MSEISIRNATVGGRDSPASISIVNNKIAHVETTDDAVDSSPAEIVIDAEGGLLLPGFVDAHTHLDKVYAGTDGSGKDSESIDAVIQHARETKGSFTVEDVHDRAVRAIRSHVRHGCTRIRTHVDVDTIGELVPFEGILAASETCREIADIEIVAFPQEGIHRDVGTRDYLIDSLERGADVIGGMPQLERTEREQHEHIDLCLELADEYEVPVDMHIDETDDPNAQSLEYLAARTLTMDLDQPVAASHACALSAYDSAHAARVIDLVTEANIDVITNPATNLIHQGGYDTYPKRRGLTRVDELIAAGVTVAAAQDNIGDVFYPYGRGDMVEVAMLAAHALQLVKPAEQAAVIDLVTTDAASVTGFDSNRIQKDNPATVTLFPPNVTSAGDLIRTGSKPRLVFHRGRLVATNTYSTTIEPDLSSVTET